MEFEDQFEEEEEGFENCKEEDEEHKEASFYIPDLSNEDPANNSDLMNIDYKNQ